VGDGVSVEKQFGGAEVVEESGKAQEGGDKGYGEVITKGAFAGRDMWDIDGER
jgi:hypothetical protein